jgi:two-component system, OmpR family, alkaline phosphatase synthesis response regulator PhoP
VVNLSKKKVLIVDDEPHIIRIIEDRLTAGGFEVIVAVNGGEGLKMAGENPDIILLDIMMPVMDGFSVLENLKAAELTKNIPVIMLTAKGERESVEKAFALGAVDYAVKPTDLAVLAEKIRKTLKM